MRYIIIFLSVFFLFLEFIVAKIDYEKSDIFLISGIRCFNKGLYEESSKYFLNFSEYYPFSKYNALVYLRVADSYFESCRYSDAISMYGRFQQMFPLNDLIPYSIYKLASSHLNNTYHFNNDKTYVLGAIYNYFKLLKNFPFSEYSVLARVGIIICYDKLLNFQVRVAKFYYDKEIFSSALSRYLKIVSFYPNYSCHYFVFDNIVRSENKDREVKELLK